MTAEPEPRPADDAGLPFHPQTVLRSLWRRRAVLVAFVGLAVPLGVLTALSLGERRYVSETVLMFHPTAVATDDPASSVETVLNLVKVPTNLEAVRKRLNDDTPVPALAAAYEVVAIRNTDLVAIRATADTARLAADRANALREAFFANQARLAATKGERQAEVVAKQLEQVRAALALADQKRITVGIEAGVIDLDKQTGAYLQQQASMDLVYGQALAEQSAVDEQNRALEKEAKTLQKRIESEQKAASEKDDLASLTMRSGRLRSSIEEDRRDREAKAELQQKEAEYRRAKELAEQGLISQSLLEKARTEYEAQRIRATDTDQISQWKDELKKIDSGVIPMKGGDTPSSAILREVMLKRLDLGLQKTVVSEKVKSLDSSREQVRAKVERLPELKRQLAEVGREVESLEQRRLALEDLLAKARAASSATVADFTVVSEALPPLFPRSSNRTLVLIAVVALFVGIALALIAGVELFDRTFRSGPEVELRAGARLLASIPWLPADLASLPTATATAVPGFFRRLAYQIRRDNPGAPLRILVTSPRRGEGCTFVASQLAAAFGRLDERVVYVDSRLRQQAPEDLRSFALTRDPMNGGALLPAEIEASLVEAGRTGVLRARTFLRRFERPSRRVKAPRRARRMMVRAIRAQRRVRTEATHLTMAFVAFVRSILWPAPHAKTAPLAFSTPDGAGLGSYLSYQRHSSKEVAHPTSLVGLSCLPADRVDAPLPESIAWRRMRDLVEELAIRYPIVVIDASGVLEDPDPEALADQADLALVVARAESTTVPELRRALSRLGAAKARVGGVILNGVDRVFADLLTESEA